MITPGSGRAEPAVDALACSACQSFTDRLAMTGQAPAFLASYEAPPKGDPLLPVLRDVAFVYDNALVAIALIACGRAEAAKSIGDALLYAIGNDRHYRDGRLRDAAPYGVIVSVLIAACALFLSKRHLLDRLVFGGLVVAMLAACAWYRLNHTLPVFEWTSYALRPRSYATLEMIVVVYTAMSICFFLRRTDRSEQADAAAAHLAEMREPPAVDVMICTYSEDLVVLERSILAALAIDYPNYSVWVLDDGRRDWLKEYCAKVGARYVHRDDNVGAKAGNLDNGLKVSAGETNAPFVLVLDADFAPHKTILKRIVAVRG